MQIDKDLRSVQEVRDLVHRAREAQRVLERMSQEELDKITAAISRAAAAEAGRLAAYYSKSRGNDKVEIDYIEKKHVKKPGGGKPGFVIYHTNYSLVIDSDISGIEEVRTN